MPSVIPDRTRRTVVAAVLVAAFGAARAGAQGVPPASPPVTQPAPASPSTPPPAIPAPSRVDTAPRNVGVLRAGDVVKLVVYREKEFSGEYLIDSRGAVQIPGIAEISVAGLGPSAVKDRLVTVFEAHGYRDPELSVLPLIRVSVIGQVRNPGLFSVDPGASVIQLLSLAGGPVAEADLRKTRVIRDGREYTLDLERALGGGSAGRVVLYSNDVVLLPKRSGFTRETAAFIFSSLSAAGTLINLIVTLRR